MLAEVAERTIVSPEAPATGWITAHLMQQGPFIIDGTVGRYAHVTTPSGWLPSAADRLRELKW